MEQQTRHHTDVRLLSNLLALVLIQEYDLANCWVRAAMHRCRDAYAAGDDIHPFVKMHCIPDSQLYKHFDQASLAGREH